MNLNTRKKDIIISLFLIIVGLTIFISERSHAEPIIKDGITPSFELIDRDCGLSNLSVSSIIQDKYGFLWFGTQGGLNYYNGRKMKIYRNNPFEDNDLVHNLIQTMYYDEEKHELWIGTYQGVSRLLINENKFINYTVEDNGLSNSVIIAITIDKKDNIWIGTMDGLNRLNPKTGDIKKYEIPGGTVRDLKVDSKGRLLIGSYEGLFYYERETDSIVKLNYDIPASYVMVIREYEEGILTLGLWGGGVTKVDLETGITETIEFKDNRIYSLIKTKDETLWVGTWGGGLFATTRDGATYHFPGKGDEQSLAHPVVYSLCQDHSDILWIGTNGGGLCKVNPRKSNYVKFYHDSDNPNSLSSGKINKILQDSNDNLWFAIYNSGLNRYDSKTNEIIKYSYDPDDLNSLPGNQVMDVLEVGDKTMLFGTDKGLAYYDMDTDEFSTWDILPDDTMVYSLEKAKESGFWIGTYRNGVYKYNNSNGELKQYKYIDSNNYSLSDNLIYDILYDSQERVWVGTNNGLNLLKPDEEEFKIYHKVSADKNQLASNTIRVLFEDSKGRIWIGMVGGGIALYNEENDSFESYTEEDGMSSNTVMGILEDDNGRIWVSTHNGISVIEPESKDIFILTPDDGIGGWEFNSGHFRKDDGTLLFGGIHGISAVPSIFTDVDLKPPKVYITNIDLYQNPIDENRLFFNDAKLEFGPNDSFLGFKFVALDFDSPEKTRFTYKLEGFDEDWINAGTRDYASYSNLPPGRYQLKVIAKTARDIKSEPVSVFFTINKPWFKTQLAYFFYAIGFVLLLLGMFKVREAYMLNKRNSELWRINSKLEVANEELEKLSTKDPLTGLFNRRYFDTVIDEQLYLAKRSSTYLSFIIFDIDDFKYINDNFGHIAGDHFLEDISKAILEVLPRRTDFVTRYGGDEFGAVLYDTDEEGALTVANKIKNAVENVSVRLEFTSTEKKATISMGVISIVPEQNTTVKMIIKTADEALYRAKQQGKNRICIGEIKSNKEEE